MHITKEKNNKAIATTARTNPNTKLKGIHGLKHEMFFSKHFGKTFRFLKRVFSWR